MQELPSIRSGELLSHSESSRCFNCHRVLSCVDSRHINHGELVTERLDVYQCPYCEGPELEVVHLSGGLIPNRKSLAR